MASAANNSIDLKNDSIPRLFFKYFIPSVCAMLALSTNVTIDGIFVGQKVGKDALAAIGISWPIFPSIIAYELLLTIGAASLSSYYLGKGKDTKARMIFSSIFYFLFISCFTIGVIFYFFRYEMALFLGASQTLLPLVVEYLGIIFLGGSFMVLQGFLDFFAINDRRPNLAMIAMVSASVVNIILNYFFIFIFKWGLFGAALATILGHVIGCGILLNHFINKQGQIYFIRYFNIQAVFISAKNGIPQAVSEISAGLMMVAFNHALKDIAGDRGNSIYSIIMYIGIIIFTILLSSAQATQPIASFNYGANRLDRVKGILKFGAIFSLSIGIILYILSYIFDQHMIAFFLNKDDLARDTMLLSDVSHAINIYYVGFIFLGFNFVISTLLQAIQRPLSSLIVTASTTLIFVIPLIFILPRFLGIDGVWMSYPTGIMCASIVAITVIIYELNKGALSPNFQKKK